MGVFVPWPHAGFVEGENRGTWEAARAELSQVLGCGGSGVTGHEELSLLCLSALLAEHTLSRKTHVPQPRISYEASD